jgi:hypothetical protein
MHQKNKFSKKDSHTSISQEEIVKTGSRDDGSPEDPNISYSNTS